MQEPAPQTFRTTLTPLLYGFVKLGAVFSVLLLAATVFGQWKAGRFPTYMDLALSAFVPPAASGLLAVVVHAISSFASVKLFPGGIQSHDLWCRSRQVGWLDITHVRHMKIFDSVRYLEIYSPQLSQPLTVPLWLKDMPAFIRAIESHAGYDHLLARVLRAAT